MKKIFIIILYILILSSKSYSNDKLEGKWINKETNSVYEIIKKDKTYKFYLVYSGRFFEQYDNNVVGSFEKTPLGYKGIIVEPIQGYALKELETKAKFKLENSKLIINQEVEIIFKKVKFQSTLIRFNSNKKYKLGESLFGIQIGQSIKNYKLGKTVQVGSDKLWVWKHIIEPPDFNEDFGTYVVKYSKKTEKIYEIEAYLQANDRNLNYTQCKKAIQPYINYAEEKYGNIYEIKKDYSAFILSKDWLDYYRLFIGCEERGYGNYHAFISLNHVDLSMLDYLEKTALPKTKKKF
tara:strand:+ start:1 stop:882 length:882 start_codon:yes stop_codon:yes gene_type:complete